LSECRAAGDVGRAVSERVSPGARVTLISGALLVTLDAARRIITDGAVAIGGDRILAVGKTQEIQRRFETADIIDGRRFVVTPGFVDAHIHITGDPLTRGYVPDDIDAGFEEKLTRWVIPRFLSQTPDDERLSAQLAAIQMLRSGTTCFLEAGTIRHLDAVVEGLGSSGIRARVGSWVEGRDSHPGREAAASDRAIRALEDEIRRHPADGRLVAAYPVLIGHNTNSDAVWQAARRLADSNGLVVSAHMSPFRADPDWYLEHTGRRPLEHLAHIGVLGPNLALTHLAHIDAQEQALLAASGASAIFCPMSALKGAFGVSHSGRFPEMSAAGVNLALGTDGDLPDLMQKMSLAAALFKDARQDARVFPAQQVLEMATLGGARALRLQQHIGSLEVGKKADLVLHDTERPEWRPLLNALHQLVWSSDGRAVHSVFVDGRRVVDDYRCTLIDEAAIYRQAAQAAPALLARSQVPNVCAWPIE
jgi:cytosine/adenosine deaminase-related metal-dependent hydrolase